MSSYFHAAVRRTYRRAISIAGLLAALNVSFIAAANAQLLDGRVAVDPNDPPETIAYEIADAVGEQVLDIMIEIGVDNGVVPVFVPPALTLIDQPARLAAYLYEAGLQYQNGNTDVALTTARMGFVEVVLPAAVGAAAAAAFALELPAVVVAVGVGAAAAGITLPAAAILVTSIIIVAGVGAAISMGAEKLTNVAIDLVEEQGVPLRRP